MFSVFPRRLAAKFFILVIHLLSVFPRTLHILLTVPLRLTLVFSHSSSSFPVLVSWFIWLYWLHGEPLTSQTKSPASLPSFSFFFNHALTPTRDFPVSCFSYWVSCWLTYFCLNPFSDLVLLSHCLISYSISFSSLVCMCSPSLEPLLLPLSLFKTSHYDFHEPFLH